MGSASSSSTSLLPAFASVVAPITGLTGFDLGGNALLQSYLDELIADVGERSAKQSVDAAAEYVSELLNSDDQGASASLVRRRLVPDADIEGPSAEARAFDDVTEAATSLSRDLGTVTAAVVMVARMSAQSVQRTSIAESVLTALRAELGAHGAREVLAGARSELDAIQAQVIRHRLGHDARRPGLNVTRSDQRAPEDLATGPMVLIIQQHRDLLLDFVRTVGVIGRRLQDDLMLAGLTSGATSDVFLASIPIGVLVLADTELGLLRQRVPASLLAGFGEACRAAEHGDPDAFEAFVADMTAGAFAPIYEAAERIVCDTDVFVAISAVLTGMGRVDLVETGQAEAYFDQLIRAVGRSTTDTLLRVARSVMDGAIEAPTRLEADVRLRLLADQQLGPVARAVSKMWYLGQWEPLTSTWYDEYAPTHAAPAVTIVVSAEAYKVGLAWGVAGGHPQGARQPGFGSWALPPGTNVVI